MLPICNLSPLTPNKQGETAGFSFWLLSAVRQRLTTCR
nr:MAG TPA: hypothetical protein [Caudoviricetes sp.]